MAFDDLKFDFKVNEIFVGCGLYTERDGIIQHALDTGVISKEDMQGTYEARLVRADNLSRGTV